MAAGGHFGWTENHFLSNFSPFQINTQLWFFFTKWLPAAILDDRKSLSNAFLAISDQYATFFWIFISKWLPASILGHFGWPKITFDRISSHFRSIRNIYYFSQNGCHRPFWMTENHFWSHFSPFQINTQLWFFSQNGLRRPFWMTENHFRMHFSPFQINMQLFFFFFFSKWLPAAI